MARTKTTAAPKTEPKATRKPRSKKAETPAAEPAPAPVVAYSPRELELRERYAHQDIQPGSWRQAGHPDRPGWGHKVTVEVKCSYPGGCDEKRIVATSDLQWSSTCFCQAHAKLIKSNRKATAKAKKELK